MNIYALIKIAGKGTRISSFIPKQFIKVKNKCIFQYTVEAFENCNKITKICLICDEDHLNFVKDLCNKNKYNKTTFFAIGGETGNQSTFNGYMKIRDLVKDDDLIISHDGVRSLISNAVIEDNINTAIKYGSAIATYQTSGNVLFKDDNNKYLKRSEVFIAQTPICINKNVMENCLRYYSNLSETEKIECAGLDDLIFSLNIPLYKSKGDSLNFKITNDNDLLMFKALKHENN